MKSSRCRISLGLVSLLFLGQIAALAQTADDYVRQGRGLLAAQDLPNANNRFASAVAAEPNHETANVFRAATRLLTLADQPAGAAFLDRLGFAPTNRSVYEWTADVARDTDNVPLAPARMSATAIPHFLRAEVLTEIAEAAANLAKVTDPTFTLALTAEETTTTEVTLDYGDLLLVRSGLQFGLYMVYTINSWDVDAQLEEVRSLLSNHATTAEGFLAQYPNVFAFASTNDLASGREAFSNGVALYLSASDWIRNRPPHVVRLFNYDPETAMEESRLRTTLSELSQSLNGPVVLTVDTNRTVDMGRHFDGSRSLRSFFPQVRGNAIIAGTLPDATFGGLAQGLPGFEIERYLGSDEYNGGNPIGAIPFLARFRVPQRLSDGSVQIGLDALDGALFVIQTSDDLHVWTNLTMSRVQGGVLSFSHSGADGSPHRFYRVFDPLNPPLGFHPPNDTFAQRLPLIGTNATAAAANTGATKEAGEPAHAGNSGGTSVWWTWVAPTNGTVTVDTIGSSFDTLLAVYTGDSVSSLTLIASNDDHGGYLTSKLTFVGIAETTYQIAVSGYGGQSGSIVLNLQQEPP